MLNRMMLERSRLTEGIIRYARASVLVSGGLVNVLLFYMGLATKQNAARSFLYGASLVALLALSACYFLYLFWRFREQRKATLIVCSIPAIFLLCYIRAAWALPTSSVMTNLRDFMIFCVPMYVFAIETALYSKERSFMDALERLGLLVMPLCAVYLGMMTYVSVSGVKTAPMGFPNLGVMTYMDIAYTLLPFLLANVLQLSWGADPVWPLAKRTANIIRFVSALVLWLCILTSATRGPIFSVLLFMPILLVYCIFHKKPLCKPLICCVSIAAAFILFTFVFVPAGMASLSARVNIVVGGVSRGTFETSDEDPLARASIDDMLDLPVPKRTNRGSTDGLAAPPSRPEIQGVIDRITSRSTLFTLAIKESLRHPTAGLGPLGFIAKYRTYPHCFLLEALSDLGLVFGLLMDLAIASLFFRLAWVSKTCARVAPVFLLLSGYIVTLLASGSLWSSPILMFGLCYALGICRQPLSVSKKVL